MSTALWKLDDIAPQPTIGAHSSRYDHIRENAVNLGAKKRADYLKALKAFGIDEKDCIAGWGLSMDKVYDTLIVALRELNQRILTASGLG